MREGRGRAPSRDHTELRPASSRIVRVVPVNEVLARQGVTVPGMGEYLRLDPRHHETDGFFAAVLEKHK